MVQRERRRLVSSIAGYVGYHAASGLPVFGCTAPAGGVVAKAPSARTGSTGSTGSAAACPSTTGVTPTDVKVGVLFDQTGANAPGGLPFGAGVEARFAVQNKNGGINGRKIVAVNADTQSSPGNGLQAAEGLVESNGVVSLIIGSQIIPTVFPYAERTNIPLFEPLVGVPAFATAKNLISASGAFDPATQGTLSTTILIHYFQQQGVKTLALFSHNTPAGLAALGPVVTAAEKAGIQVVYKNTAIPFSAFDATSIALRMKQLKPDATYLAIALAPSISIVRSLQQQNSVPRLTLLSTGYGTSTLSAGIGGTFTSPSTFRTSSPQRAGPQPPKPSVTP